ncbi:MAG: ABC transporter ATP-binding protein, partial [Candidatus Neomarinimicrobiota bacterium]
MKIYLRMMKFVLPYWKVLMCGILASLLYVVFNSSSAWLTASLVNVIFPKSIEQSVQTGVSIPETAQNISLNDKIKGLTKKLIIKDSPLETLKTLCIIIFITFFLKNVFFYLKGILLGYIQLRLITDLRNKLYFHLHNLSFSFFDRKRSGEISSIILNDVEVMRRSFAVSFNKLLVEPINILMFAIILFIISWQLTLMAIIILPVSGYIITKVGQSIRRKSIRTSRQIAGIMSILSETLYGIRVVKAFAMEKFETNRFLCETRKYFRLLFRRTKLRTISTPLNETFGVLIGVILLWYGGAQVLSGTGLESEDFIRFVIMLFAIMQPIKGLNNVNVSIQQGVASATRVFSILDEKPDIVEKPDAIKLTGFNDKIEYEHVSFHYDTSKDNILSDVNFEVKRGEVVAIVGHSGAGKSTLVDLLPRFYDLNGGSIKIDGIDIRDVTFESLRSLMGIVTQETILFNDTIFNNIAYGMVDANPEYVKAAANAANALEFINDFPEKFQTLIGDKGTRLSGGQRQRLAIARALLKNPPILILDEATSSLDSESEQKVQMAIDRLMRDRTVLVIAHRLATIQNANKIVVLEDGKIVESGTHSELLKKNGLYRYLYDAQFNSVLN